MYRFFTGGSNVSPGWTAQFPVYLTGSSSTFSRVPKTGSPVPDSPACIGFLSDDASAISDAVSPSRRCRRREFCLPGRSPTDVNLADNCARGVGAVCVVFTTARMRRRRLCAATVLFRRSGHRCGELGGLDPSQQRRLPRARISERWCFITGASAPQ